jgi:hypothetical protein
VITVPSCSSLRLGRHRVCQGIPVAIITPRCNSEWLMSWPASCQLRHQPNAGHHLRARRGSDTKPIDKSGLAKPTAFLDLFGFVAARCTVLWCPSRASCADATAQRRAKAYQPDPRDQACLNFTVSASDAQSPRPPPTSQCAMPAALRPMYVSILSHSSAYASL